MGLHSHAWSGINIVIIGTTPLVPMHLEQVLAQVSPSNELRLESFEDFEQAFDFCKDNKNVGFFLLLENQGMRTPVEVFRALSRHYESRGIPAFAGLLYEKSPSVAGYRSLAECRKIVFYESVSGFLSPNTAADRFSYAWQSFVDAFEQETVPRILKELLIGLAAEFVPKEAIVRRIRVNEMLASELNISWIDLVNLRLQPIISILQHYIPAALASHDFLKGLCQPIHFHDYTNSIAEIASSAMPLVARINAVSFALDALAKQGDIVKSLEQLAEIATPMSPALVRKVISQTTRILDLYANSKSEFNHDRAG